MTIIVEDGSIVAGANSYVSEADLTAFATARGISIVGTNSQLLLQAMDFIENLDYQGFKSTLSQPLIWPRWWVYIDGYYITGNTIPRQLKDGLCWTAIAIDQGNSPLAIVEPQTSVEKVGDIEVHLEPGTVNNSVDPRIMRSLRKILLSGGNTMRVNRG